MTDSDNITENNWRSKQNWIKDVLSKSGTELMEISRTTNLRSNKGTTGTTTTAATPGLTLLQPSTSKASTILTTTVVTVKNGNGKKSMKKNNGQDSSAKMVYYPSTPLIVKTEQSSQAQFCMPLRTSTTATPVSNGVHQQLLPIHAQQQNSLSTATTTTPHNYNISHNNDVITLQQQQHQPQSASITINNSNTNGYQQPKQQNYLLTNIKSEQLPPSITLFATTTTSSQPIQQTGTPTTTVSNVSNTTTGGRKPPTNNGNKPQFKCEQCGMIFGSKSAHTSHTKSHAKSGELTTIGSGNVGGGSTGTNSLTQMNAVELNEAGVPVGIPKMPQITPNATGSGDPYQCNVCQKTFAVPARLIRHYRTHTGERPFECEFCHKLFSVKENLQVHRRIHTKERPYKCDVCGRAFEHSGKLHRHMRIHTGERPHKCSVCDKTFIQSGQLVIHMRTHTGEKPYKCPVEGCGKGFTCSKQLKVHSRTHTGEKPYHCDICFRDFGYNHVLKLHRVQHYGSKCYKCTICDKTFKSKKEMEAHIKGHANEMPDDDDDENARENGQSGQMSSISSSGGETTNSAPGSPQSPSSNSTTVSTPKTRKPRQPRAPRANNKPPPSPSSPSSTYSPPSSLASVSRLSAGSPLSSVASPVSAAPAAATSGIFTATSSSSLLTLETEMQYNSRDSGIATSFSTSNGSQRHLTSLLPSRSPIASISYNNYEELPTDLSIGQHITHPKTIPAYQQITQQQRPQQTTTPPTYTYLHRQVSPPPPPQLLQSQQLPQPQSAPESLHERPTINPALLEAASIASEEGEVTQAALQILQLHRSTTSNAQHQSHSQHQEPQIAHHNISSPYAMYLNNSLLESESSLHQDDDTREANELIARYKRGELARHGLHKPYKPNPPVPKFEPSLLNNEFIVRQVEAAIAPLRSSTESPERSSSPESDSMMLVGDRDIMTLPLRKRKVYMHEDNNDCLETSTNNGGMNSHPNGTDGNVANQKVMRISSVIQFAKAS